jgi:hypothetical protein
MVSMSSLLWFKLVAAPLLIGAATLAARRWGAAVGGWIAGLPLTSALLSVFFAVEEGPLFARDAAQATILGVAPVVAFAAAYGRLALQRGPLASAIGGLSAYFLTVAVAASLSLPAWLGASVVAASVAAGIWFLGCSPRMTAVVVPPRWDLPFRMVVALSMILLLTEIAALAGPRAAGVLTPFPSFAGTMVVFAQVVAGPPAAHRLARGVVAGSLAFASFFLVVATAITALPMAVTFALATLAAGTINTVSLFMLLKESPCS